MVLTDTIYSAAEYYQRLTCRYASEYLSNGYNELKALRTELRNYEKENGLEGKLMLRTFNLSGIKNIGNTNVVLVCGYTTDKNDIARRVYQWFEVPDIYVDTFIKKECHYTIKQSNEDVFITNEFGCSWDNGVGCGPDGRFCGECSNITRTYCPVRGGKK